MLNLLGQTSEVVTIALPIGVIVVASQAAVNAITAWASRRNGSWKLQQEIRDALRRVTESSNRTLLEEMNRTMSRIENRLDRQLSIMEGERHDAKPHR